MGLSGIVRRPCVTISMGLLTATFIVVLLSGCGRTDDGEEASVEEDGATEIDAEQSENGNTEKPLTIKQLFEAAPEATVIIARDGEGHYLGSFYPNRGEILKASFDSSAARIEIRHLEARTDRIEVYFLLQLLGDEMEDDVGPEEFFRFEITSERIREELSVDDSSLVVTTTVEEVSEDEIPE